MKQGTALGQTCSPAEAATLIAAWTDARPGSTSERVGLLDEWISFLRAQDRRYAEQAASTGTLYSHLTEDEMQAAAQMVAAFGVPSPVSVARR